MTDQTSDPAAFGWTSFFASQLDIDELETLIPARVMAVHRGALAVAGPGIEMTVPAFADGDEPEDTATVGDWLLLEPETHRPLRLLNRTSLIKRRAPGTDRRVQLIAANIDTMFIASSCNQDFNIPRLERYLALAREADVMPVMVLTKADMAEAPEEYARQAAHLLPGLLVETVDARDPASVACLAPWCGPGQTVALVGSSGVGKSTLVNTLSGRDDIATQAIREDDSKGRHTTSGRSLHRLPAGGWLLDTPGMRELQLADAGQGLEEVFADLVDLAANCRFSDCRHDSEPGCAIRAAAEAGDIEPERLKRWNKLAAEERHNSASLHERHASQKAFGKMIKRVVKEKGDRKR